MNAVAHVKPFVALASNRVEGRVAQYIDHITVPSVSGDLRQMLVALQEMPDGQAIASAYRAISSDSLDNLTRVATATVRRQSLAAEQRLRDLRQNDLFIEPEVDVPPSPAPVGASSLQAESKHRGRTLGARLALGCVLVKREVHLEPYGSIQYARISEGGFAEQDGGAANLKVLGRTTHSLVSESGLRVGQRVKLGEETTLFPELNVGLQHDFQPDDRELRSGFVAAPGTSFTLNGRRTDRNRLAAGARVRVIRRGNLEASLEFDSLLGARERELAGSFRLELRF
ncbi:MAG: autotransporter domain-containing protein [Myxococcota bacterium]